MIRRTASCVGSRWLRGPGRRWQSLVKNLQSSQNSPAEMTCRCVCSDRFLVLPICTPNSSTRLLPISIVHNSSSSSVFSTFSRKIIQCEHTPLLKARIGRKAIPPSASVTSLYVAHRPISEDRKTKALTVWGDLVQIKSSPLPALVLGLSGLLPFIGVPVYMILTQTYLPSIAFAQTVYGAIILSFLGGVRWGLTLPEESVNKPDWRNLTYSVVPPLIAWAGLLCVEPIASLTIMTGLAGLAYFDTMMYGYPPWFKALRFLLSLFAVLSLWTTFVCKFLLDSKKPLDESKAEVKTLSNF